MDTELLQALGAEVAEELAAQRMALQREFTEQLATVQRAADEAAQGLRERLAEMAHQHELALHDLQAQRGAALDVAVRAEMVELLSVQRAEVQRSIAEQILTVEATVAEEVTTLRTRLAEAEHRAELAQRDLEALQSVAGDPVAAFSRGADGSVCLIQRHGPPREVPLPDVMALVREAVDALGAALRDALQAEAHAEIARSFELFCNAPAWSETTVYMEGQIVQTDIGRTYRVRRGIKATTGRFPGDDAEHWERLGTAGLRVLKSRPPELTSGDLFTEHDARFLHDGRATILLIPKAPKLSDIERAVKGPHALAQATQAELREAIAHLGAMLTDVQRSTTAANDAGALSVQTLAAVEGMREELDALRRRVDELDAAGGMP